MASGREPLTSKLKTAVRRLPVLGPVASRASLTVRLRRFPGSVRYWEQRYRAGGSSGAGSCGAAARYKAGVINDLIARHEITSILELGCGDGVQVALGDYPPYVGLDVSPSIIRACGERFSGDCTKSFFLYEPYCFNDRSGVFTADAALSLDVIFHLVEDPVFTLYMTHLFGSARRFVIIYSSDYSSETHDIKLQRHVRHRRFSSWVEAHMPEWELTERIPTTPPPGQPSCTSVDFFVYSRRPCAESGSAVSHPE